VTTTSSTTSCPYTQACDLAAEISELSAYLYAATYRLLVLIREFDENNYWEYLGMASCAHWLNFKCGLGIHAAREKVRVANALANLPAMSKRFERGELSYSKVRAMTRIANKENEDYLLGIAKHGTAHHVEKLVSLYRGCKRQQDNENANEAHKKRELQCHYDTDGCLVIHGRIPAEQGALILKALDRAMEKNDQPKPHDQDVPAGTPEEPFYAQRADALAELSETYLASNQTPTSTADRYQVVVHVSPQILQKSPPGAGPEPRPPNPNDLTTPNLSHIENGPHVPAGTSRRIACDCAIIKLTEDNNGEPLSIGRKTRTIPPAINRVLKARDKGCRFPGCTHTQFIDGHHIQHRADGGETSLDNLVQLCRRHHRLVHEGGFGCERSSNGTLVFKDPRGNVLADYAELPFIEHNDNPVAWLGSQNPNLNIDANTCIPETVAGERMDWNLAVGHLFTAAEPEQPRH